MKTKPSYYYNIKLKKHKNLVSCRENLILHIIQFINYFKFSYVRFQHHIDVQTSTFDWNKNKIKTLNGDGTTQTSYDNNLIIFILNSITCYKQIKHFVYYLAF